VEKGTDAVVVHQQGPVLGERVAQSWTAVCNDGKTIDAGFHRQHAQTLKLGRHEEIVEGRHIGGETEDGLEDGSGGKSTQTFLHHRHHRAVAGDMEMIALVVGKGADYVAEHGDALLWLEASSEEDVQLAVDKARINLLLYYAHAVVDDWRIGSEALLIRLAYRIGDADVGVMANEVWLYKRGDGRQTAPETSVVDGADDACAAKEEGEEAREGL
jgi:hypothetical protein